MNKSGFSAEQLAAILAPFAQIANKHAMSDVYKCIAIAPQSLRGCAPFGILEAAIDIGIPDKVWLDAISFAAVIKSLPAKEEVEFEVKGGALYWQCGMADGKLALMRELDVPAIPAHPANANHYWNVTAAFLDGIDLGSLSCGAQGMASAGTYGLLLDNRGDLSVLSSDNITVTSCVIAKQAVEMFPEQFVMLPEAGAMLATVIAGNTLTDKNADTCARLMISEKELYCVNKAFQLSLRPIAAMKHDLRALIQAYGAAEVVVDLPRERIGGFIKRAGALAESKQRTYVALSATEGALSMSFSEGTAATDEYYLVEGLDVPTLPEIKLDAGRVARVLAHVSQVVLDHMERGVLVLRSKDGDYSYMISARSEKA